MTIGELKAQLADLDDGLQVVMSADSEGNSVSPLADLGVCEYTPESTWSGEIKTPDGTDTQAPEDWDPEVNVVNAICLWPVQ